MSTHATSHESGATTGRLRVDSMLMFANRAGVGALNLAATVIVARALGPAGRGAVAVAVVLLVLLVQLGSLGIATANPVFTARDRSVVGRLVSGSLWLGSGIGAVTAIVVVVLRAVAPSVIAGLTWLQVGIVLAALPAALAALFLQSLLLGLGRTLAYNGVELALGTLSVAALLAVALGGHLHTTVALALLLAQYPVMVVAYLRLLAKDRPFPKRPDLALMRSLTGFAVRTYAATVLALLVIRFDLVLVNAYLGASQAGFYSVAVVLTQTMYLFPVVVGVNILPRVARGAPAAATAQIFRIVALIYGGMCLLAAPLASPVIHLVFGSRFGPSVRLFYWLLPGIFSLGLLVILGSHLSGRGYPLRGTLIWALGLAFNVVANVILLPRYGTYMASIVSSVTYTGLLLLNIRLFTTLSEGNVRLWPKPQELRLVWAGLYRGRRIGA